MPSVFDATQTDGILLEQNLTNPGIPARLVRRVCQGSSIKHFAGL